MHLKQYMLKPAVWRGFDFLVLGWTSQPPLDFLYTWYSPFKKVLVISQCSVSFQQSAAGCTFHGGSAGSLTHAHTHIDRHTCCYGTLTETHTHTHAFTLIHSHTHTVFKPFTPSNKNTFPPQPDTSLKGKRTNSYEDLSFPFFPP